MNESFRVGDVVENFGAIVKVVRDFDPTYGLLVEIIPAVRGGVQQGGVGQRYYADPAKCKKA